MYRLVPRPLGRLRTGRRVRGRASLERQRPSGRGPVRPRLGNPRAGVGPGSVRVKGHRAASQSEPVGDERPTAAVSPAGVGGRIEHQEVADVCARVPVVACSGGTSHRLRQCLLDLACSPWRIMTWAASSSRAAQNAAANAATPGRTVVPLALTRGRSSFVVSEQEPNIGVDFVERMQGCCLQEGEELRPSCSHDTGGHPASAALELSEHRESLAVASRHPGYVDDEAAMVLGDLLASLEQGLRGRHVKLADKSQASTPSLHVWPPMWLRKP